MVDICKKPNKSCNECQSFRFDTEKNKNVCFARQDAHNKAHDNKLFEDYLTAISMNDIETAQNLYPILFSRKA